MITPIQSHIYSFPSSRPKCSYLRFVKSLSFIFPMNSGNPFSQKFSSNILYSFCFLWNKVTCILWCAITSKWFFTFCCKFDPGFIAHVRKIYLEGGMLCFLSICGQFAENNELFVPWPFSHDSCLIFFCWCI